MNKGLKYSIILHLILIVSSFIYISKNSNISSTERVITVDLVNVKSSSTTNLKNSPIVRKTKKVKTRTTGKISTIPLKTVKKNIISKKTSTPRITQKNKKSNKKVNHKEKVIDDTKIDKEVGQLLDNLEKNFAPINNSEKTRKSKTRKANLITSDKPYDKSLPLTIAERDNIKTQIERKFFNPIVSDFNSGEIIIKIKLDMAKNGEIKKVSVLNRSSYASKHSDAFIALRDSLVRAAHMASPIRGLNEARYEGKNGWKEIELIFDAYYLMNT